jgi:hypothetical protein
MANFQCRKTKKIKQQNQPVVRDNGKKQIAERASKEQNNQKKRKTKSVHVNCKRSKCE